MISALSASRSNYKYCYVAGDRLMLPKHFFWDSVSGLSHSTSSGRFCWFFMHATIGKIQTKLRCFRVSRKGGILEYSLMSAFFKIQLQGAPVKRTGHFWTYSWFSISARNFVLISFLYRNFYCVVYYTFVAVVQLYLFIIFCRVS